MNELDASLWEPKEIGMYLVRELRAEAAKPGPVWNIAFRRADVREHLVGFWHWGKGHKRVLEDIAMAAGYRARWKTEGRLLRFDPWEGI